MKLRKYGEKSVRRKLKNKSIESIYDTAKEMLKRAKGGYFARAPERNFVMTGLKEKERKWRGRLLLCAWVII